VAPVIPSFGWRTPYLRAVHYFGRAQPVNFWEAAILSEAPAHLAQIRADGFNAVIIIVPWRGFQRTVEPPTYDEQNIARLRRLLAMVRDAGLNFILRISFPWNNDPDSVGDYDSRIVGLFTSAEVRKSWLHYVKTIRRIAEAVDGFQFAFFSWEDLPSIRELMGHRPLEQRLALAEKTGYRTFLEERYSLAEVSRQFAQPFTDFSEVFIPQPESEAYGTYHEFIDRELSRLLADGRVAWPRLAMQMRVDHDRFVRDGQVIWIEHDMHVDDPGMRVTYFFPFMYALCHGEILPSAEVLFNLQRMLHRVTDHGRNTRHFIDQFVFADESPQFTTWARVKESEMEPYLVGAARLLQRQSRGFAFWNYYDYRVNHFYNAAFIRGLKGWQVRGDVTLVPRGDEASFAALPPGAALTQRMLPDMVGYATPLYTTMTFAVVARSKGGPGRLRVTANGVVEAEIEVPEGEHRVEAPVPPDRHRRDVVVVTVENIGANTVDITEPELWGIVYRSRIRDEYGEPGRYLDAVRLMLAERPWGVAVMRRLPGRILARARHIALRLRDMAREAGRFVQDDPKLAWKAIGSLEEYNRFVASLKGIGKHEARLASAHPNGDFTVPGRCWIDSENVDFAVDYRFSEPGARMPNWREHLVCPKCHLNNRQRSALHIATELLGLHAASRVYITEQVTAMYTLLKSRMPATVGSEFLGPDFAPGHVDERGIRHEDVTRLSFDDASFDAILCFDVLEHVPGFGKALAECHRVLAPGGSLICSVPFLQDRVETRIRARFDANGELVHDHPPSYHGDPIQPERGVLCFQEFGWDILDQMRAAGFEHATAVACHDERFGYLGGLTLLFVARKKGVAPAIAAPSPTYEKQLAQEVARFGATEDVHALPDIAHYWAHRWIRPKMQALGFAGPDEFFTSFLEKAYHQASGGTRRFVSLGAGNCDTEIRVAAALRERGLHDFVIECLEASPAMLERGRSDAQRHGLKAHVRPVAGDFNAWRADGRYDAVMANQSLHHVTNLEGLFDTVGASIDGRGLFAISDMIGRNGHLRWPEALAIVQEFWKELPKEYRRNLLLNRQEDTFLDWDCSVEGFEGIRAQDILPLLIRRFSFDLFAPYANVVDPFVDRAFGPHFDLNGHWDIDFITRVHERDEAEIRRGAIKPTHLFAVLGSGREGEGRHLDGLTPEFCVR
jgi:SAM-dependent methyltransferase